MEGRLGQLYHRRMLRYFVYAAVFLPAAFARADSLPWFFLDVPRTVTDVFAADTGAATLYHYARDPQGRWVADPVYMSIGENGVGKARAGDRKTPLGVYFVVDQLDTSRLHEKYGITAFPLDYPNVIDRAAGKTGDGIWVHGVQKGAGRRPERDTDGCLALPNEELDRLVPAFAPGVTPVVVTRGIGAPDPARRDRLRIELAARLAAWVNALATGDRDAYEALYGAGFTYRGLDREAWQSLRDRTFPRGSRQPVEITDTLLLADPEDPGLYLSRFRLRGAAGSAGVETVKRLYWQRGDDGLLRIVAEDNG